jgi:hypothetical protein
MHNVIHIYTYVFRMCFTAFDPDIRISYTWSKLEIMESVSKALMPASTRVAETIDCFLCDKGVALKYTSVKQIFLWYMLLVMQRRCLQPLSVGYLTQQQHRQM